MNGEENKNFVAREEKHFATEDASRFYEWLGHYPTEWTEIRAIDPDTNQVETVFVNSKEAFLQKCGEWSGTRHVYAGVNPRAKQNGKAEDVARVTGIPFDVDPPKTQRKQSATDHEKQVAFDRLQEILRYVHKRGFGEPYLDDSGNGYRLTLKVNLPTTNHTETTAKLQKFFEEFKGEFVFLDNISDLPRIIKVPGTWSLKGEDTPERPHRQSKLIQLGDLTPNEELQRYILGLTIESETSLHADKTIPATLKLNEKKIEKLRPCFQKFIEVGGRFTPKGDRPSETRMRQQFVKEMTSAGFSKNEILAACIKFDDYEKEKTEYEISKVYSEIMREGLTHWTCNSIHKHGGCLGPECRLYAKKIEGTVGTQVGNYWLKKKRNRVFLVDENNKPLLSCNLDSVDGPRFKKKLKEKTGLSEAKIDKATASFQFTLQSIRKSHGNIEENEETKEEEFDEETENKARDLLCDPAFFYKLGWVFKHGFVVSKLNKARFIIGEERNKRLLGPLLIGAAKLGMTSIVKLLGEIATAKDTMLRMWLDLLPIKSVERSYFTAAGLRYSQEMKDADLLYVPDSPELHGEMGRQMRFMRADDGGLISEYATRDAETGEMVTKISRLPVKAIATTSNALTGDTALESGMWTLQTNATESLTKKVKEEKLKLRAGKRELFPEDELKVWRCAFKILVSEELPDALPDIPFAEQLIVLLESGRSKSRRDPDKLCDLISLIAWGRRFQKKTDERDEAGLIDLYSALQIGLDAITQTISELDEKEERIFHAVKEGGDSVTVRDVTEETKIPYETCYRYLERLVHKGFLNQDKEKGRNIYSILGENTPKQLFVSEMKSSGDPTALMDFVLESLKDSSTLHGGEEILLIDPISGAEVKVNIKGNGQSNITVEKKNYSYPYEELKTSERSENVLSEEEKKPKQVVITEIKRENEKKPDITRVLENPKLEPMLTQNNFERVFTVLHQKCIEKPYVTIEELAQASSLRKDVLLEVLARLQRDGKATQPRPDMWRHI